MAIRITPHFKPTAGGQFLFESAQLNEFLATRVFDTLDFYQRQYGVYGMMQLTEDKTYRSHSISANPFLFQAHNSCAWNPTGTIERGLREITPYRVSAQIEDCYDQLFDSCFKHFVSYDGQTLNYNELGDELMNRLLTTVSQNLALGIRLMLTGSGAYNTSAITYRNDAPNAIRDAISRQLGVAKGWLKLAQEAAASGNSAASLSILQASDFSGKAFTGNVLNLVGDLYDGLTAELGQLVDEGGVPNPDGVTRPVFLASTHIYKAIVQAYRVQSQTALMNNARIEKETINGIHVYSIDGIVVVPTNILNEVDKRTEGGLHFLYLVASGNIQMGGSFTRFTVGQDGEGIGLMIQRSDRLEDLGKFYMRSDNLVAPAISDINFIAGTQIQL